MERSIALGHGVFWMASGLWPIVHLRSFAKVTGPKPEGWLVKTVGGLITVVGATLTSAARRNRITPEIRGLAIGSALALTIVDVVYPLKRRISPVYLLDAAVELAIAGAWAAARRRPRLRSSSSGLRPAFEASPPAS